MVVAASYSGDVFLLTQTVGIIRVAVKENGAK